MPIKSAFEAGAVLFSIFREDLILSDEVCYQFTTRPRENFHTFSETFIKKFPGYKVDSYGAVKPGS